MKAGKVIAIFFFASWIIGIGGFIILRPTFKHGKDLLKAVEAGQTERVSELLQQGANVHVRDHDGHTALWIAAYQNRADLAEELLKRGAEPDARGLDGWTPLMWAANNGNTEVVRVLLKYKANVNAKGMNGETALSLASGERRKPVADLLRKAGAR